MPVSDQLRAAVTAALDRGHSLRAIAIGAGISQPTLFRWYHRQNSMTLTNADKLATYFGMRLTKPRIPRRKPS